jgi:hypothetical protein
METSQSGHTTILQPDFQTLFESTHGPILVLAPNSSFTILASNDAYLKVTKIERDKILDIIETEPKQFQIVLYSIFQLIKMSLD